MNISDTIIANSAQLNADDIIGGPIIIEITGARPGPADQPVCIDYVGSEPTAENKDGRPYKPNKTMRKILSCLWGDETDDWTGTRRLQLYRDEHVKWGGKAVGGIVIQAASHIGETRRLSLNETRNKKKMYVIEPLPDNAPTTTSVPNATAKKKPTWDDWFVTAKTTADKFKAFREFNGEPPLSELSKEALAEVFANPEKYGKLVRGES